MHGLVIKYWVLIYSLRKPAPIVLLTKASPGLDRLNTYLVKSLFL